MDKCNHKRGASVPDLAPWVCADCYALLDQRPIKYGMAQIGRGYYGSTRQDVVWKAEDIPAFAEYLGIGANYIVARSDAKKREALRSMLEMLRYIGAPFGDPCYCWDLSAARDVADEILGAFEGTDGRN